MKKPIRMIWLTFPLGAPDYDAAYLHVPYPMDRATFQLLKDWLALIRRGLFGEEADGQYTILEGF